MLIYCFSILAALNIVLLVVLSLLFVLLTTRLVCCLKSDLLFSTSFVCCVPLHLFAAYRVYLWEYSISLALTYLL